jgi:hypothetical protein
MCSILGDFLERISLLTMQQLVGSEYPTWVRQDAQFIAVCSSANRAK